MQSQELNSIAKSIIDPYERWLNIPLLYQLI